MSVEQKLHLIKTWTVIHLEMLKKFKKMRVGMKIIASSDEYARLFQSILRFFVPPQS